MKDFLTRDEAVKALSDAAIDARAEHLDSEALALSDAADLIREQSVHQPIYALCGTHHTGLEVSLTMLLHCHVSAGRQFYWVRA